MSSPDPLNDSAATPGVLLPPSTRRVTRSIRSDRFSTISTSSPRKQMFELEVGDDRAPQKLLVTVETEDSQMSVPGSAARRRLFQPVSSTPLPMIRRMERATTTTIPLRGGDEDEFGDEVSTPKRRGRPRKSNGTPLPTAGMKRRAGTPIGKTPRRMRMTTADDLELSSEASPEKIAQPTPKSARRGRPPKKRPAEASSEVGTEAAPEPTPAARGRRRRQGPTPGEVDELANEPGNNEEGSRDAQQPEDDMTLVQTPADMEMDNAPVDAGPESDVDAESDIWMATMDDEATPRAANRASQPVRTTSSRASSRQSSATDPAATSGEPQHESLEPVHTFASRGSSRHSPDADSASVFSQADDYGDLPAAASDDSSLDDAPSESVPRTNDTIAQGEDFSMIFMDSIPSLQASLRGMQPPSDTHEIGEETGVIINNTLESLRQSLREEEEEEAEREKKQSSLQKAYKMDELMELENERSFQSSLLRGKAPEKDIEQELEPEPRDDAGEEEGEEEEAEEAVEQETKQPVEEQVTQPAEPSLPSLPQSSPTLEKPLSPTRRATSFSSRWNLSPRWTQSPRRLGASPLRHQLLKFKAKQTATTDPTALHDSPNDQTPTKSATRREQQRVDEDVSNAYEDSFSEIPQDILEAATPGRALTTSHDEPESDDMTDEAENEQSTGQTASNTSGISRSDAGRLPTPDDTPPQVDFDEVIEQEKPAQSSQPSSRTTSPTRAGPAPKIVEETVEEDEDENGIDRTTGEDIPENLEEPAGQEKEDEDMVDQIPAEPMPDLEEDMMEDEVADQLASEAQAVPEIREPEQPLLLSPGHQKPQTEVTPLNQLSSPVQEPQSLLPDGHHEKLRPALSPIVRAGRALQSVTSDPPSPEGREQQLRSPFRSSASRDSWQGGRESQNGQRFSSSPRRPLSYPPFKPTAAATDYDDPFGSGSGSKHTGQRSFMEALNKTTGNDHASAQQSQASSKGSPSSSMHIAAASEDGMSWVENEGPISANLRGDNSLRDLVDASASRPDRREPLAPDVPISKSEDPQGEVEKEVDPEPQPQPQPQPQPELEEALREQDDDDMDIWEFEAERDAPQETRQRSFGKKASEPTQRRSTLPSPWTKQGTRKQRTFGSLQRRDGPEPKPQPEPEPMDVAEPESDEEEEFSMLVEREKAQGPQRAPESANKASRFDLSAFFSSPAAIPGMLADKFLPAKTKSLFGARSNEPEPEIVQSIETEQVLPTSSMFPQVPQKEFQPRRSSQTDLFSPIRPSQQQKEEAAVRESPRPSTPERNDVPIVEQKKNFTPRPSQPNQAFFQASASRSSVPTPPRMQLSHADIERWQQETSNASEESPEVSRLHLRPLPPRGASPIKSSLRSPLKPHTPGRVVEFTSSVLSPVEQARIRQQRHLSNDSESRPSYVAQGHAPERENKENRDASLLDASFSFTKESTPEPLSQTVWTRQHWLLLDELLQMRRGGPFEPPYERRADAYLGKTVRGQGEALKLERWHLDCVDAFKAEVGGWDEGVLAKRLFALIMGEERRSRGVVERPSRVMFH